MSFPKIHEIIDGVVHSLLPPPREEKAGCCYWCGSRPSHVIEWTNGKTPWCGECDFEKEAA